MTMQADAPIAEVPEAQAVPVVEAPKPPEPVQALPPGVAPITTSEAQQTILAAVPAVPVVPSPVLPSGLPTNLPPEVQEYVNRLEEQTRIAREQNELQVLNDTVAQYAQQLENQGFTADQAKYVAKTQGDILYRQYQTEQLRKGQVNAAFAIAKEFTVDPRSLMDLTSPQAMRQTAQSLSAATKQAEENAQLRARIVALEKGRIPAQIFSQSAQPNAGVGLTGDALEAAWIKHEIEERDKPNPYDIAYRALLRG